MRSGLMLSRASARPGPGAERWTPSAPARAAMRGGSGDEERRPLRLHDARDRAERPSWPRSRRLHRDRGGHKRCRPPPRAASSRGKRLSDVAHARRDEVELCPVGLLRVLPWFEAGTLSKRRNETKARRRPRAPRPLAWPRTSLLAQRRLTRTSAGGCLPCSAWPSRRAARP